MARQAALSMGFSRQEYWSGLLFPPPVIECEVSEVSEVNTLSCVGLVATCGLYLNRLLRPWDFPGKGTGKSCHFLLQN